MNIETLQQIYAQAALEQQHFDEIMGKFSHLQRVATDEYVHDHRKFADGDKVSFTGIEYMPVSGYIKSAYGMVHNMSDPDKACVDIRYHIVDENGNYPVGMFSVSEDEMLPYVNPELGSGSDSQKKSE